MNPNEALLGVTVATHAWVRVEESGQRDSLAAQAAHTSLCNACMECQLTDSARFQALTQKEEEEI